MPLIFAVALGAIGLLFMQPQQAQIYRSELTIALPPDISIAGTDFLAPHILIPAAEKAGVFQDPGLNPFLAAENSPLAWRYLSALFSRKIHTVPEQAQLHSQVAMAVASRTGFDRAPGSFNLRISFEGASSHTGARFLEALAETLARESQARNVQVRGPFTVLSTNTTLPVWKRLSVYFVVGLALGYAIAARPFFSANTAVSVGQLRRATGRRVLGSIPRIARDQHGPLTELLHFPNAPVAVSMRDLRATMSVATGVPSQVLVVTSPDRGAGVTTGSLLLAQTLANWGRKVLYVDTDISDTTALETLGLSHQKGLLSVLAGLCSTRDALARPDGLSFDVLLTEHASAHAADVLATDRMKMFITWAKQHYDHIVLDTAPILEGSDTRTIAPLADRLLVFVRWRKTSFEQLSRSLTLLESAGSPVSGLVLTCVDQNVMKRLGYEKQYGSLTATLLS